MSVLCERNIIMKIHGIAKLKQWMLYLGMTVSVSLYAQAAEMADEIGELKKLIQQLDQKVKVLERNRELEAEAAEAKKKETPRLSAGQDGFVFSSGDSNFVLRVGAHI